MGSISDEHQQGPGGYEMAMVAGPAPDNFFCSRCNKILRQPWQSSCGHRFCAGCLTEIFRNSRPPTCPVDHVPITKEESFRDVFAEREVMSLRVRCPSTLDGAVTHCTWVGELQHLQEHEDVCEFVAVPCQNGCRSLVARGRMDEHLRNDCPRRSSLCQHCKQTVQIDKMAEHLEGCTHVPIPCPNNCPTQTVPRCQMAEHLAKCPKQVVNCFYQPQGCDFEGFRADLPAHHQESMPFHLQICVQQLQGSGSRMEQVMDQNRALASRCDALEKTVARLLDMHMVEGGGAAMAKQNGRSSHGTSLKNVEQTEATELAVRQEIDSLRQQNAAIERQQNATDRTLALHDIQLSDLNIRQDLQEIKTTTGTLVWKVSDFSRRRQEAISGRVASVYSPPFYTSPSGYKMCARLYLNGDGSGKGTHLSLFFVVMKGEFDALLPWPFSQKVSLSLLDQNSANPRDVVETFRPDPASSSFQRPDQEMNIASGCPRFLSLSALNTSTYLREDTLFFKISVHTNGLRPLDQAVS